MDLNKSFNVIIILSFITQILCLTTNENKNVNKNTINRYPVWDPSGIMNPNGEMCFTNECYKIGLEFSKMINESIDPCNDFYEYVCGKFSRNTKIPENMVSVGVFQNADELIKETLEKQLTQPSCHKCDPLSIRYATDLYNGCVDINTTESRGVQPLLRALEQIGGWPLIQNVIPFYEFNYHLLESLAHFIAFYGESAVIDIGISADWKNTTQNILYLGPATDLHFGATIWDNFQNLTRNKPVPPFPPTPERLKWKLIDFKRASMVEFIVNHILKMVEILGGNIDNESIQDVIDILVFSSKLSEIQTSGLDFNSVYNKMTLREFEELSSGKISWLPLINRVYELLGSKKRFTYNDYCIVTDVGYFRKLPEILLNTSKRVFANFLGQILVNDFGVYTVEEFRKLNFELLKLFYNLEKAEPHWKFCVSFVRNTMGFAISRKFIKQNFLNKSKVMVTQLVKYISEAFYQLIENNPILSDYSRKKALTKLTAIKANVGYPLWLFDDTTLDSLYTLETNCERNMFFECVTYFTKRLRFKIFNSKDETINREIESWAHDPTIVNAAYDPTHNSITISAAIINALFGCENPRQLNYAKLGVILGHELTHGFDPTGNKFDERGNLNEIFDKETRFKINEKEMCFINQYNNYCDSGRCVNGELTIGENTADNGGMRETYKAYQTCSQHEGQSKRLPYMSEYTTNQIFFISYATLWCESMRKEYLPVIYNDVHSPNKFRVNGVLSNFQPFSDAFKCSNNSTLNAKNKCIVW